MRDCEPAWCWCCSDTAIVNVRHVVRGGRALPGDDDAPIYFTLIPDACVPGGESLRRLMREDDLFDRPTDPREAEYQSWGLKP